MIKVTRFTAITVLLLALPGCVTVHSVSQEVIAQFKRVGVVSQVGSTFYRQYVGITIFGNESDTLDVSGWNLDEIYEDQISKAVRSIFDAEAISLGHQRSQFADVNSLNGPYSAPAFWGPNFRKIAGVAQKVCREHDLDALVIAAKWQSQDPIGGTNQKVEGVGVYARSGTATVHVFARLGLVSCSDGAVLAMASVLNESTSSNSTFRQRLVISQINIELGSTSYNDWGPEDRENIVRLLQTLPKDAWHATLQTMIQSK